MNTNDLELAKEVRSLLDRLNNMMQMAFMVPSEESVEALRAVRPASLQDALEARAGRQQTSPVVASIAAKYLKITTMEVYAIHDAGDTEQLAIDLRTLATSCLSQAEFDEALREGDTMSEKIEDGGPAFPHVNPNYDGNWDKEPQRGGMSLRQWYAGQALAMAARHKQQPIEVKLFAEQCFQIADAMLEYEAREALKAAKV